MAERSSYQLTEAERTLLAELTRDALEQAGSGSPGGGLGGRIGARFTKPHTFETTLELRQDPGTVRERAHAAIDNGGAVLPDPNEAGDGSVWGVVASGIGNMMPALVRVEVSAPPGSAEHARVHIRATGNEGLVKQKIGAKAADRIAAAIAQA